MKKISSPIHLLVIGSEIWISNLESTLSLDESINFSIEKITNDECIRTRLSHNHYDVLIVQGGYCKCISDKEVATLAYSMGRPVQIVYNNIFSYLFNRFFIFGNSSLFRKSLVAKEFVTLCNSIDAKFITRIRILSKIYSEFFNEIIKSVDSNYYKYCPQTKKISKIEINVD